MVLVYLMPRITIGSHLQQADIDADLRQSVDALLEPVRGSLESSRRAKTHMQTIPSAPSAKNTHAGKPQIPARIAALHSFARPAISAASSRRKPAGMKIRI